MSEPIQSTEPDQRPTVALVFGGDSSEHQVSCLTAGSVARAIDPQRYRVVGIGITRSGRWVRVPLEQIQQLQIVDRQMPSLTEDHPDAELVRTPEGVQLLTRDGGTLTDPERVDVAFALLHGPHGEDGTIQGLFELLGLRYVGSGVAASAIGMDKHLMKLAFAASGIPIGPFVVIQPHEWEKDPAASLDAVAALDFPVFVKPARGGSSVGITKVDDKEAVAAAIEEARRWDPKVLVEQGFVDCREVECGVLGGRTGEPGRASSVAEIRMHNESGFYDFEAKYLPEDQVSLDVPARIDPETTEALRALAVRTFDTLGCEGLARVDFFVARMGRIYVNEINTMPGFTATSMFPLVWQHAGLEYPQLIDELLQLALNRPLGLR
ncbi:D-alanine-D-alanine ligase [Propionibacteriaceae bacterium ES.041]|uniref:D-alanine--D-alanine ligase family protein n=1 Tax=Enemella evansiae TaxID=2016499 RepID=UPI000C01491B|nr:D-alanine--D-alanine ligase family protein [Enemella evansiae]PFG66906.1 D-alanine-D-alanine ligase [Propionibacteriaceae bacterium ES.041]